MWLTRFSLVAALLILLLCTEAISAEPASVAKQPKESPEPPKVGDKAPDFSLESVRETTVKVSKLRDKGPVVLVVLRGYPGYQCPICSRQVGDLLKHADDFKKSGAQVVLVYPGPSGKLKQRAQEFIADRTIPEHFHLVLDPDYNFTNAYGLRWEAPRETAYPSTFVIARDGTIKYAKVSKTHAGRAPIKEVLNALQIAMPAVGTTGAVRKDVDEVLSRVRTHEFHPVQNGFTVDKRLKTHGIADLADQDWRVRLIALRDLLRMGPSVIPALIEALEDDNLHVRHICCFALGLLREEGDDRVDPLHSVQALESRLRKDSEPIVRSEAAVSLGRLVAHSSLGELEESAEKDSSRDVQHQCMLAIDRIRKNVPSDDVLRAFKSLDESVFNSVEVGKPAVDFALTDTNGDKWRLSTWRGKKTVLLIWIFADWCPVCHREFSDLIELKQELMDSDVFVATIECHDLYRSRVMVGKEVHPRYWFTKQSPQQAYAESFWWTHLSDPAGSVGAMYGVAPLAFAVHSEFVNRPSTIIVDKDGVVRFAYYGTFWGDRPSIRETLAMIKSGEFEFEHSKRLNALPK